MTSISEPEEPPTVIYSYHNHRAILCARVGAKGNNKLPNTQRKLKTQPSVFRAHLIAYRSRSDIHTDGSFTMASRVGKQFRMWMPTMPMTMVSAKNATARQPAYAIFRVLPKMTKHEIKEYLVNIYQLPVRKVNTMNYDGKRKRIIGRSGMSYYKYADFKKAVVTFEPSLQDVGLGMRIPELEDDGGAPGGPDDDAPEPKQIG
jgi:large subunit ribosomal protein L23